MKSIASVFLVVLIFASTANAHVANKGYCQKAETTADIVECIRTHQNASSDQMDALFSNLKNINPDNLAEIESNQGEWIQYRDKTCEIEGKTYEGGSLQQVQRAQCMARMTDNRNIHLRNLLEGQDVSNIPEYSNPPRWVNVLVRDYPNMFWNLGNADIIDTDCDGVAENIIRGMDDNQKMTLAIADSEQTGRPKITVINFDDAQNCEILAGITVEKFPKPKPTEDMPLACMQSLKIQTKSCGEFEIHYTPTDKIYSLKK